MAVDGHVKQGSSASASEKYHLEQAINISMA